MFVTYTLEDASLVLSEFHVSGNPDWVEPTSEIRLLRLERDIAYHFGASLAFGADGLLYISSGDGSVLSQADVAQNLSSLRGKLLRVDVDAVPGTYAIPTTNPLVGVSGVAEEIIAYGLRNPWRVDIDPATQDIYIADVGLGDREEIDVLPADTGQVLANFGWPRLEGSHCAGGGTCEVSGVQFPTVEYDHGDGCAVIGGAVYRGCAMPGHHGTYFYSDYCGRWVRSFSYIDGVAGQLTTWPNLTPRGRPSSFGRDGYGELYLLDYDEGTVHRIVPAP